MLNKLCHPDVLRIHCSVFYDDVTICKTTYFLLISPNLTYAKRKKKKKGICPLLHNRSCPGRPEEEENKICQHDKEPTVGDQSGTLMNHWVSA